MTFKTFLAALAALTIAAPAAFAIEFSETDIDEDMVVTEAEFDDVMPDAEDDLFAQIDADQDGKLTETEWNSAMDIGLIPSS